jgi:hypothetical protein
MAVKTTQQLYDERRKLYEQQYEQQRLEAERAKESSLSTIKDTMAGQQQAYQQGIQQAGEDSFSRGRNLMRSLANRGLATSGLMQLGDVQSKVATGKTLTGLATANADVLKSGAKMKSDIYDAYQSAVASNNYDLASKLLASDESLAAQVAAEKASTTQNSEDVLAAKLEIQNAAASGQYTTEQIAKMVKDYEEVYGSLGYEYETPEDVLRQESYDTKFKEKLDWGALNPFGGTDWIGKYRFNIGGTASNYDTIEDAVNAVKDMYTGSPYLDKIEIKSTDEGKTIKFYVNGKAYDTYNKAVVAVKASK